MKKQYTQPQQKIIVMKYTTTLMSGSNTLGVGSGTKSATEALSREFDYGDDFDE